MILSVRYARERTLSIHSIVTTAHEVCYWLTVLVTSALGTAAGDRTLELTGWTPGSAVLRIQTNDGNDWRRRSEAHVVKVRQSA